MIDFQNGSVFKLKQTDTQSVMPLVEPLLIDGEQVISAYKSVRDCVIFTDKRVIAVNVQGMTGKKRDYSSLTYAKLSAYSVETAGVGDIDSELELWYSGLGKVRFEFAGKSNILQIGQMIARYQM